MTLKPIPLIFPNEVGLNFSPIHEYQEENDRRKTFGIVQTNIWFSFVLFFNCLIVKNQIDFFPSNIEIKTSIEKEPE